MLTPLGLDELRATLRGILDTGNWSLRVLLTNGDQLFGDFVWHELGLTDNLAHVPAFWDRAATESGVGVSLSPVQLIFNAESGTVHGEALTVEIPEDLIASIAQIEWREDLIGHGLKNISNPIATAIASSNRKVAANNALTVHDYFEGALPREPFQSDGITFVGAELLYADFDYFRRLSFGSWSAGVPGAGLSVTPGLNSAITASLRKSVFSGLTLPSTISRHAGFIEVGPPSATTELEGDTWEMWYLSPAFPATQRSPVLLRRGGISYPRELWSLIRSPLVVVGEVRQIPFADGSQRWPETIMARAIGFTGDSVE